MGTSQNKVASRSGLFGIVDVAPRSGLFGIVDVAPRSGLLMWVDDNIRFMLRKTRTAKTAIKIAVSK